MRLWQRLTAAALLVMVLAGLGAAAYRVYAPGPLSERIDRAQRRWEIFGQWAIWKRLAGSLGTTLQLAVFAIILSLVLAIVLALIRLSTHQRMSVAFPGASVASGAVATLVEIVRSSPLFMLIIYAYIGLPRVGLNLSPFVAGVAALTLYTACVMSEIVRAGILSLERGQFEAAHSIGLSYWARVRFVVLPQALRRMVPSIVSQLVTLIKDTSLVSFITVFELARRGQTIQQLANNPIETSIVLMAIYFAINFALSELSRRLEIRPGRVGRAKAPAAVGAEDLATAT